MKKHAGLSLLILALIAGGLAGCGNNQQANQSDNANNRTNDTSEYVQKSMNHGTLKNYINNSTYDKIHNTVVVNVHKQQNFQNQQFQHALKNHISHIRHNDYNPHVKVRLVRTNNSNADND